MEVALKLAYQFALRAGPRPPARSFSALDNAYHGDTVGAVSLGHIDLFHRGYSGLLFKTGQSHVALLLSLPVQPRQAGAGRRPGLPQMPLGMRRQGGAEIRRAEKEGRSYAAFVFEPLMQGAAGMIPQPSGWLGRVAEIARGHGALLIADEVMTALAAPPRARPSLLACHQENVHPDFAALAKGLTGGYLPWPPR